MALVDHILYENSSLAVVIGNDIWRYKEVDGEVKKDKELLNVHSLSTIVLHDCGSQLTYAGADRGP